MIVTKLSGKFSSNPNDYRESNDDGLDLMTDKIPVPILKVLEDTAINENAKIMFMRKFGMKYITSEKFEKMFDGYFFLFVNGNYEGAYSTEQTALFKGLEIGGNIYIRPMYLDQHYEYKEFHAISKVTTENIL